MQQWSTTTTVASALVWQWKPWALTSGNSNCRGHMYYISTDAMSLTDWKVVTEWAQSGFRSIGSVGADWYMDLSTWSHHLNKQLWCPWPLSGVGWGAHWARAIQFHSPLPSSISRCSLVLPPQQDQDRSNSRCHSAERFPDSFIN